VLAVVATVLAATTAGILLDSNTSFAPRLAHRCLMLMLYIFVPFVALVSFAHIQLSLDAGVGLLLAYAGLALAGLAAYAAGTRWLALSRPALGALICTVLVVNTGYLGLPTVVAVLGASHLSQAVAYDQIVSGPTFYTVGFAIGALFGSRHEHVTARQLASAVTRNPPLLAAAAGLVLPASLIPSVLVEAARPVVDGLLVVGFVVVGISLSAARREDYASLLARPNRHVGAALIIRFGVTPAVLIAASLAGLAVPTAYLLQAAMPTGVNSLIIGHRFGLDQRLIATTIVWSTLAVAALGTIHAVL
jgi:predicted permease